MLSLTRDGAAELNQRARATLLAAGELGDVEATIEDTGIDFRSGDTVVCLRNDRRLGIRNGDIAVVRRSTDDSLVVETARGQVELPAAYLAAGHLDHGYALTVHKAQGATYDVALLLGDHHLYAEAGYTALTRGRDRNHAYVLVDETSATCRRPSSYGGDSARSTRRRPRSTSASSGSLEGPDYSRRSAPFASFPPIAGRLRSRAGSNGKGGRPDAESPPLRRTSCASPPELTRPPRDSAVSPSRARNASNIPSWKVPQASTGRLP